MDYLAIVAFVMLPMFTFCQLQTHNYDSNDEYVVHDCDTPKILKYMPLDRFKGMLKSVGRCSAKNDSIWRLASNNEFILYNRDQRDFRASVKISQEMTKASCESYLSRIHHPYFILGFGNFVRPKDCDFDQGTIITSTPQTQALEHQLVKRPRHNFKILKSKLGEDLFTQVTHSSQNVTYSIIYDCDNPKYLNYDSFPVSVDETFVWKLKNSNTCSQDKIWRFHGNYIAYDSKTNKIGLEIGDRIIIKVMIKNACKEYFTFMGHPFYNGVKEFYEPEECNHRKKKKRSES